MEPRFFATSTEFRAWLERITPSVSCWSASTRRARAASITWPEAVDEALCFGWIDGVRRSIDEQSYSNRFTPRRPRSNWSAINIKRAHELIEEGRMTPAGLAAFEARTAGRSAVYSYEQRHEARLDAEQEARFRGEAAAWEWFQGRPPSFRRAAVYWVTSAKRAETRERRLASLIEAAAEGRPPKPLAPPGGG